MLVEFKVGVLVLVVFSLILYSHFKMIFNDILNVTLHINMGPSWIM